MDWLAGVLGQGDSGGLPGVPDGVESVGLISTWVVLVGLLLRGSLRRSADCDSQVAAVRDAAASVLAAVRDTHAAELANERSARALVQQRLDAVVADRDAWRDAQREEAEARRAAERMARDMMESTNVSLALLGALKDMAAGKLGEVGQ